MAANVANAPQFFILDDRFAGRGPRDRITVTGRKGRPVDVQPWHPNVLWKEELVAGEIARHAAAYIEEQKDADRPFFLYFASNIATVQSPRRRMHWERVHAAPTEISCRSSTATSDSSWMR